jgi:hypothetical protein
LALAPTVTVELYGVARHRAECSELIVHGGTILEVLRAVEHARPVLTGLVSEDGSLSRQYLVSFDGERFVENTRDRVPENARILILGADPGG